MQERAFPAPVPINVKRPFPRHPDLDVVAFLQGKSFDHGYGEANGETISQRLTCMFVSMIYIGKCISFLDYLPRSA